MLALQPAVIIKTLITISNISICACLYAVVPRVSHNSASLLMEVGHKDSTNIPTTQIQELWLYFVLLKSWALKINTVQCAL